MKLLQAQPAKGWGILLLLLLSFLGSAAAAADGKSSLVEVGTMVPGIVVEMRYATANNFTGRPVYHCGRCFLKRRTAQRLALAQSYLKERGFSLKVWDCYRPLSVQKILWGMVPDSRYVADPKRGSRHNRGTAVDVTLVDAAGKEVEMPTDFDDFSGRAATGEQGLPAAALANRELLVAAMRTAGFRPLDTEWWHFDDPDGDGELLDVPACELCR